MTGFHDPDYARDRRISEQARRISALEQRVADLERARPAKSNAGVCQGSEADTAQGNPATDEPTPTRTA